MTITRVLIAFLGLFIAALPFESIANETHNFAASQSNISHDYGSSSAAKTWLRYYKDDGANVGYKAIMDFISRHPDFPRMEKLRARAEKAMPSDMPDAQVLDWFSKHPPETSFGMKIYADALMRAGRGAEAKQKINDWWVNADLTSEDQAKGLSYFQKQLSLSSHQERLRILIHRDKFTNARKLASMMGNGYLALAEARVALQTGKGNADAMISRIPSSLQNDEGLLYDRLVFRRKKENNAGAVDILSRAPSSDKMHDPEDWGKERQIIARRYFEQGNYSKAYQISKSHRTKDGMGFSANEWMAGWIALEFLNKPSDAFKHFESLYRGVESPISKSRAAYWAGRASEQMKYADIAAKWYESAARYPANFYGQMAIQKLGLKVSIPYNKPASSGFQNSDLGQAAKWLRKNGYKEEAGIFLNKMIDVAKTPGDFAAVAELANAINMKNLAIKSAQESEKKTGVLMAGYAFPKLERFMSSADVEWALVHALIRQESRFDTEAVSSAGARGLMQLMPRTAAEVAKQSGIPHQKSWLISNPAHNISLGSRYFKKLVDRYDGNYAMALAGYNAGPGRVGPWVDRYGDPRSKEVDLINWIESIPIYETRNYVQRVLEGVYVYRNILSTNKHLPQNHSTHIAAN